MSLPINGDMRSSSIEDDWTEINTTVQETTSVTYTVNCVFNTVSARFQSFFSSKPSMGTQLRTGELINFFGTVMEPFDKEGNKLQFIATGASEGDVNVDNFKFDKTLVIPVLVKGIIGFHMTLLFCEKTDEGYNVEFYDGKALPITDPLNAKANEIYMQIKNKTKVASFKELKKPVQFDAHSCGVLAPWYLEQRLNGCTFADIANSFPHAIIEQYRENLVERTKKRLG